MENMVMSELTEVFKNKRVLITGHTGFKGSWMCLLLRQLGAKVFGYALEAPTKPSLYELANIKSFVNSYEGDIRNKDLLLKAIKEIQPEFVIHMAAQPLVSVSYVNPVDTYAVNVLGTANLLDVVRSVSSVRVVVNVTTDKCYENNEWVWPYRENDRLGGYDPYSNSKACSELVTSSFSVSFFNTVEYGVTHHVGIASARSGNVIGGGDWAKDRLIPDFIRAILKGDKVIIRNPQAIRPWQHVLEPLIGYLMLSAKLYTDGVAFSGAWNFGPHDKDAKDVGWIIDTLCSLWGENISYSIEQSPSFHEANYLKLDCSKSQALLKWEPRWDIYEALKAVTDWTRAYQKGRNIQDICCRQINDFISK